MNIFYNHFKYPIIETDRLTLRFLEVHDWEAILFLRSDEIVNALIERPLTYTKEEAIAFIDKIQKGSKKKDHYYWPIALKQNNIMIGSICLWNFSEDRKIAEVGYDLRPDYHKKGIMNEAMISVLKFGFHNLELEEIEAYTHKDNTSSKNLLTRNGFKLIENKTDSDNKNNVIYSLKKVDL